MKKVRIKKDPRRNNGILILGRIAMGWTEAPEFFRTSSGAIWHRPRYITTHYRDYRPTHTSVQFHCGNIGMISGPTRIGSWSSTRGDLSRFAESVPHGASGCRRCEEAFARAIAKSERSGK